MRRPLLLAILGLVVAGVVVLAVGDSEGSSIAGATILGLAGILAVALAFLEVGYSEDRERARRTR